MTMQQRARVRLQTCVAKNCRCVLELQFFSTMTSKKEVGVKKVRPIHLPLVLFNHAQPTQRISYTFVCCSNLDAIFSLTKPPYLTYRFHKKIGSFELDGGWLKPLAFHAFARKLTTDHSKHSSISLLILARRHAMGAPSATWRQNSANNLKNCIATTSNEESTTKTTPSSLAARSSSTNSISSVMSSGDIDDEDNRVVLDVVRNIDDQYVLACGCDGAISACSTIVDALFDRHGVNTGRIADCLLGGQRCTNKFQIQTTNQQSFVLRLGSA